MKHFVVAHDKNEWCAVPANNGACSPYWQWGNEILVGYTKGKADFSTTGHQVSVSDPYNSYLALSKDGGETWINWKPDNYAGCQNMVVEKAMPLQTAINFNHPNLVMRIEGNGYHGNSGCQWYYSIDKGKTWKGAYSFGNLFDHDALKDKQFTGRTAYIVNSSDSCYFFLSVRESNAGNGEISQAEKVFLAQSNDGGLSFDFISWVVPETDPYRAVMPSPVRLSEKTIVIAIRRKGGNAYWIDAYITNDNGENWDFLSKIGDTGDHNGNPPAMIALDDGRLCCVYGNRKHNTIIAKYSADNAKTWHQAQIIREDMHSINGYPDIGYPRIFQRPDQKITAVYFWCSPDKPETHIAATIFEPVKKAKHS